MTEAGYDAAAWIVGLLAASRVTGDLAGATPQLYVAVRAALAVSLLSVVSGLLAGLYRRRYQRGSFDEVVAVGLAAAGTAVSVALLGSFLIPGQRAALATVAGSALLTLPAMFGARYVALAVRLRSRAAASSAVKIIIFGAGSAGTQLVQRLAGQRGSAYLPVAMLDDNPAMRRLRIRGIPVLGGREQMAEAAAATGATVLVIAIARASGPAIRELARQAEECGLVPKVIPSINELLSGSARIDGVRDPQLTDLLGRAASGDRRRRGGQPLHRQADPGDRRRRVYRLRALPPAASVSAV